MVDITNRMEEADISSGRYDMSVSPSKLMDTSFGDALTSFGNLVEGAAKVVDDTIKRNIQSDLFNAVDQADRELGVTERVAAEASIDAPEPIKENMNKMANYREAVAQGRMSETQFYNRMDSVVRQLRVKYPGYRDEIDQLAGQVIGFDTANTIRKRMFAEQDQAAVEFNKRYEAQSKLIEDAAKAGVDMPLIRVGMQQLQTQGYMDTDILAKVQDSTFESMSLKARQQNLSASLEVSNKSYDLNVTQVASLAKNLQSKALKDIVNLGIPKGPNGEEQTLSTLYQRMQSDGFTQQEAIALRSLIMQMKMNAKKSADDFYNTRIEGSDKTFANFTKDGERLYDGGLAAIQDIENVIFGKSRSEVEFQEYLIKLEQNNEDLQLIRDPSIRKIQAMTRLLGKDSIIYAQQQPELIKAAKNIGQILQNDIGNAYVINGYNDQTPFVQTAENGIMNGSPVTTKQYVEGMVDANSRLASVYKNNPTEAYKLFKAALGPNRSGQHMLTSFSVKDRVKIFSQLASPEFSKFIKDKGTEQMKSEYSTWLRGAFEASFREDISNVRSLSAQDMIGYQLSYDPKSGFSLERESMTGSVFSDVTQGLAANTWGITQWRNSIQRVNEFITTYRNALPESLTDKQQAEVLNEMIQSLGVGTEPSQAGGFWSQVANRVQNWIASGDSNVKVDPISGTTTRAEFFGTDQLVAEQYSDVRNLDIAAKTLVGEARGETSEGRQAIAEVLRNRSLASGRSIAEEAQLRKGGSKYGQFSTWNEGDPNLAFIQDLDETSPLYVQASQDFLSSANSDLTKGATHYYNPDIADPPWARNGNFVETARIGKHVFGYLKEGDPYLKGLSKYRDRSEFD